MTSGDFFVITAVVVVTVSLFLAVFMIYYRARGEARYNEETRRAEVELLRRSMEEQIDKINERLASEGERWKDMNHLLLTAQATTTRNSINQQSAFPTWPEFLARFGITPADLEAERRQVFVLTPFSHAHQATFEAIADACKAAGLNAIRGDETLISGDILPHILRQIARSRLVIANIDGRNPNVYYELGIAHAMGKNVILVSKSPRANPFDLQSQQMVFYKDPSDLRDILPGVISKALVAQR